MDMNETVKRKRMGFDCNWNTISRWIDTVCYCTWQFEWLATGEMRDTILARNVIITTWNWDGQLVIGRGDYSIPVAIQYSQWSLHSYSSSHSKLPGAPGIDWFLCYIVIYEPKLTIWMQEYIRYFPSDPRELELPPWTREFHCNRKRSIDSLLHSYTYDWEDWA